MAGKTKRKSKTSAMRDEFGAAFEDFVRKLPPMDDVAETARARLLKAIAAMNEASR